MRKRLDVFYSDPGSRYHIEYDTVVLPDGRIELVENGKTDIQEYIDSFSESCSIENIVAMCAAGDTSALSKRQGQYIDTSDMPKTFRDVLDIVIRGENQFEALPADVKAKFENDFNRWFATAGSEEWLTSMGFVKSDEVDSLKKEVIDNAES